MVCRLNTGRYSLACTAHGPLCSFSCPSAVAVERGPSRVDHVKLWRSPLDCGPQCHSLDWGAHPCPASFLYDQTKIIKTVYKCPQLSDVTSAQPPARPSDRSILGTRQASVPLCPGHSVFARVLGCPEVAPLCGEEYRARARQSGFRSWPHTYQL